ncbi:hypothetical protein COCC4DRAFT_27244 [Bipolaris maydis ATCC 48331]|uniref:Amine oxidase domain-containing protein n=1 Tax=Cochliobolus heterostrophus (strain C4 / ATCC 48331 / race T) TaxID=665024 RepID=N4WK35_COCH4|nr:uncharacterized protein COCC4DRAFT_27244 [Bipolaris maydis ATCC 48331]ENI00699.1 hypothetical protein COCC4DRAFT_27244 [Bipolaris maydis ATCC 48331]
MVWMKSFLLTIGLMPALTCAAPTIHRRNSNNTCRKTKRLILSRGGGVAGITAAQALFNQSVSDFLILEYQDRIRGRMLNTGFDSDSNGDPYTVELGANWISGLGENTKNGPENPVWTFSKQVNLTSPNSDAFSIATYNETGAIDYTGILDEFEETWTGFEQRAGTILSENPQDRSARAGFWQSGWRPKGDPMRKTVEYYLWDWETAQTPEESGFVYGITGWNLTYYGFSEESKFCADPRGFSTWLKHQASKFLQPSDPRLLLNTIVTNVSYSDTGEHITTSNGSCVEADYAISTIDSVYVEDGEFRVCGSTSFIVPLNGVVQVAAQNDAYTIYFSASPWITRTMGRAPCVLVSLDAILTSWRKRMDGQWWQCRKARKEVRYT